MKCSICIGTKNHGLMLDRTLASIYSQRPPFDFEVVVADDGSEDDTLRMLSNYPQVKVISLQPTVGHTSGRSRNAAMRAARGEVIIHQSDEVLHVRKDTIERLVLDLRPQTFIVATVYNYAVDTGSIHPQYTPHWDGNKATYDIFYLGSSWRSDVYKIGGNDPDFEAVKGGEDLWLTDCLKHGLHLTPTYSPVLGLHQDHPHNGDNTSGWLMLVAKRKAGVYCSSNGPWEYTS